MSLWTTKRNEYPKPLKVLIDFPWCPLKSLTPTLLTQHIGIRARNHTRKKTKFWSSWSYLLNKWLSKNLIDKGDFVLWKTQTKKDSWSTRSHKGTFRSFEASFSRTNLKKKTMKSATYVSIILSLSDNVLRERFLIRIHHMKYEDKLFFFKKSTQLRAYLGSTLPIKQMQTSPWLAS